MNICILFGDIWHLEVLIKVDELLGEFISRMSIGIVKTGYYFTICLIGVYFPIISKHGDYVETICFSAESFCMVVQGLIGF